jgi:hypothetical protein
VSATALLRHTSFGCVRLQSSLLRLLADKADSSTLHPSSSRRTPPTTVLTDSQPARARVLAHSDTSPAANSITSSSGGNTPLISPSLLIPLSDSPPRPVKQNGVYNTSLSVPVNTTQRYDTEATDRDYKEALARLDHATLSDDQMLSSFKREPLQCSARLG